MGDFPRYESPAGEAPFKRTAEEIAELFFSAATIEKAGQFTVISEDNVNYIILQELQIFADENNNGIYDAPEEVYQSYNLMIFISKDVSYLKNAFENTDPAPGDVCIYLEDNSSDTFSGKTAWKMEGESDIVVGSKVIDELSKWFPGSSSSTFSQFTLLEEQYGFNLDFSQDEMMELIRNGELKNASRSFSIGLFQVLNSFNILAAPVYKGIGELLLAATEGLRGYIKFQDYHWDPEAQVPAGDNGETKENSDFYPVLLPFSYNAIDKLSELEDGGIERVTGMLQKQLRKQRNIAETKLKQLSHLKGAGIVIPENILPMLENCTGYIEELTDKLMEVSESIVTLFASLGKKWLNAINAFYCGLWNGLVESVLGIVDLVGYFFVALGMAGEAMADAQRLIPEAQELLDETIQTILEADIIEILSAAVSAIIEGISNFNLYALTGSVSLEKAAYFVGGMAELVVEMVVGIFWSGGIDSVRAAVLKFGKMGEDIYAFLFIGIKKILGSAVKFSIENMLIVIRKIIELLKRGKEEIVAMIRSIFEALQKVAKLADEIIREIIRVFQLTPEELELIDEIGLSFVKYSDETCSMCMITYN